MAKNRVEELESRVSELEATVRGLTEELVEANERIRTLESHVDGDATGSVSAVRRDDEQTNRDKGDDGLTGDEPDADGSEPDDIIVA